LLERSALADDGVGESLGFERYKGEEMAKDSSGGARLGDVVGPEEASQAPVVQE
jgi:hypothetical protein